MVNLVQSVLGRREYIVLAAMLEFLHAALWIDFGGQFSRIFILIHLGLFLIWQPVQKSNQNIAWNDALIFILLAMAFSYFVNWWLVFVWLILLIGIVGGRVVINRIERFVYFLVMIFLVSELLLACIPSLFAIVNYPSTYKILQYIIAVIPLLVIFFPKPVQTYSAFTVDLVYAVTASLLASLLSLGSLVIMYRNGSDYFTSLIQTLLVIGFFLILISWLLSTRYGFRGFSQLWTRSLLNIGTPFEDWLNELSISKQENKSSKDFFESAMNKLLTLPWMTGVEWQLSESKGLLGKKSRYDINLDILGQPVILYTRIPAGGALLLHCKLLIQLIEYFYESKLIEHELARQAHLQAIYETGARITHDIKNLVQSMHSMVTILQADTSDTESKSVSLLKKQFPYFIQRLEQAMYKLQAPKQLEDYLNNRDEIYLNDWWREIKSHYKDKNIKFESSLSENPLIPLELFETVIENLLENAISKRKNNPEITITVNLTSDSDHTCLTITDSGNAIEKGVLDMLFKNPIKSDNGLGIGLLQAYKLAAVMNFNLSVKQNENGVVSFELRN